MWQRALWRLFPVAPVLIPKAKLKHHLTPTASMLVSRGWVMREVERVPDLNRAERNALVDALCAWEPPRNNSLRTNFLVWVSMLGMAMLFGAVGLPGWLGFVIAMGALIAVARALVVRQMRWKLGQLLREREGFGDAQTA
jgi:hypothetical protein